MEVALELGENPLSSSEYTARVSTIHLNSRDRTREFTGTDSSPTIIREGVLCNIGSGVVGQSNGASGNQELLIILQKSVSSNKGNQNIRTHPSISHGSHLSLNTISESIPLLRRCV